MRAARFHEYGEAKNLMIEQAPDPHPRLSIGERVFGLGGLTGATAELVILSAWARTPAEWTDEQAAGAGLASVTAMRGLNALGDLAGRTLLLEGAAGGVGSAAVEIAVARGATVIGTASERNHDFLTRLGALPTTYGPAASPSACPLLLGTVSTSRSTPRPLDPWTTSSRSTPWNRSPTPTHTPNTDAHAERS